jgi:hypothetical protein
MRPPPERDPYWEETRPAPPRPRSRTGLVVIVAVVVSALTTLALNFVLVPGGVGWRKLEHEGTVSVNGINAPLTVQYPSKFAGPPSLTIEPVGNDVWFYSVTERTENYFIITNTTVNKHTGEPVHLTIKWKATGARW